MGIIGNILEAAYHTSLSTTLGIAKSPETIALPLALLEDAH